MLYEIGSSEFVRQLAYTNIQGNVVHPSWGKFLKTEAGKPDATAMLVLSELLYWCRPVLIQDHSGNVVAKKKFAEDMYRVDYDEISEKFGFSVRQVKRAISALADFGVIRVQVRAKRRGKEFVGNNVYIAINVQILLLISPVKTKEKDNHGRAKFGVTEGDGRAKFGVTVLPMVAPNLARVSETPINRDSFLPPDANASGKSRGASLAEKQTEDKSIAELEAYYAERRFGDVPVDKGNKKQAYRDWHKPIRSILAVCGNDVGRARRAIREAIERAKKDKMINACPRHIQQIAISIVADNKYLEDISPFAPDGLGLIA